jgi:cytochrome c-type biogenesis protein CcmE
MAWTGRKTSVAVGGAVVLLVFAYLIWGGIGNNLVYFLTPSELSAKGAAAYGASIRLGGVVEASSIRWDADKHELRFRLVDVTDTTHAIEVVSTGLPPQMFSEGIGAVVEGVWSPDGVFHCHNLMVKHSNEYRAPPPGSKPAEYYRQLFRNQRS